MKSIIVNAEHEYPVLIGQQWSQTLIPLMNNRARVAVIISARFSPNLDAIKTFDAEVHVFEVPDGEEGKSSTTLINLWNWLGAAGFTRSDYRIHIGNRA